MKKLLWLALPVIGIMLICGLYFGWNKLRAKEFYNQGAQAFNKGSYLQAEIYFKRALELNPDTQNVRLFYAAAIRAQFLPNESTMENVAVAKRALQAYQNVIKANKNFKEIDLAHAAIADLYKELGERDASREWLMRRIELAGQIDEVRFKSYYAIAVSYWEESAKILQKYQRAGSGTQAQYQPLKEWQLGDAEKAKDMIQRGLESLDLSLKIEPKCADCYNYRALLNRDLYQVESDARVKAGLRDPEADMIEFQRLKREEVAK
jgi:tetratricopeptide (TPR) repeat protein